MWIKVAALRAASRPNARSAAGHAAWGAGPGRQQLGPPILAATAAALRTATRNRSAEAEN
ncbi:hypothetical protein GCM10010466_37550 [Planomonospora alba]|uniref:Uncharacterized protein n=1 Tax=Planomonospora alba TaxID=161354 RepID=A0ABP6NCL7_9ACTN